MVYLVDDDSDDQEIVQEALIENSYKGPVIPIGNGKMLMDKLHSENLTGAPSVIVLDLNMPLLDGFQTLERIRKHPVYSSTPVIILTASSKKEDEEKSYRLGCNFFLTKPSRMSGYAALATLVKRFMAGPNSP